MAVDGPALVLSALTAATGWGLAARAWHQRHRVLAAGAAPAALALSLVGLGLWCTAATATATAAPPPVVLAAMVLLFAGVGAVPVGTVALARAVADSAWRPGRAWALLLLEPAAVVALAASAGHHDLLYTVLTAPDEVPRFGFGPLFWVHSAYGCAVVATGLVVLLRRRGRALADQRRQMSTLLAAAGVGAAGEVCSIALQVAGSPLPVGPASFLLAGLVAAHGVLRQGALQLVPVAREQVLEVLGDAVVVVDALGRVLDANPAAGALARRLFPAAGALVGQPLSAGVPPEVVAAAASLRDADGRTLVEATGVHLDVRAVTLRDRRGRAVARVLTVRDVTEEQEQRRALQAANARLEVQLRTIDRLRDRLAEEATRDPLTGLHNRRHLERALRTALSAHRATGVPLAVAVVDVDRFKAVNDTHGHAAGDRVLRGVAEVLRAATRGGDVVARLGGEEFVLLLPGADRAAALERAEQVRSACEGAVHTLGDAGATALRVTLSAGVAAVPGDAAPDADALLAAADAALYAAKDAGRNLVR